MTQDNEPSAVPMAAAATMDGDVFESLLGDWPTLIGRFICAFSACEYWTYVLLEGMGGKKAREAFAGDGLDRRVDEIKRLAKAREVSDEKLRQLGDLLGELRWLGRCRNLASHNAPMAHIYVDDASGEVEVRLELRGANRPEEEASQQNLRTWFDRARALEEQLARIAGLLSKG